MSDRDEEEPNNPETPTPAGAQVPVESSEHDGTGEGLSDIRTLLVISYPGQISRRFSVGQIAWKTDNQKDLDGKFIIHTLQGGLTFLSRIKRQSHFIGRSNLQAGSSKLH